MKTLDYSYIKTPDGIKHKELYKITVDNSKGNSHNVNIDYPEFQTFAYSEAEAIGIMIQSDFKYRYKPILTINEMS